MKKKKRRRRYPRVPKKHEITRERLIELIKRDFRERIDDYHISLLKVGASYTEVEDCVINDIFRHIVNSYGMDLVEMEREDVRQIK